MISVICGVLNLVAALAALCQLCQSVVHLIWYLSSLQLVFLANIQKSNLHRPLDFVIKEVRADGVEEIVNIVF